MLTGIIITKNEEKNILKAISNLDFCDEIIVCDNASTDNTTELAKNQKARVFSTIFTDYSQQRNFALEKANNSWVFFLDADEKVGDKLKKEIQKFVQDKNLDGVYFRRENIFFGKTLKHGEVGNVKLLRLGRKNLGEWKREVHEYWDIQGNVVDAKNPIIHNPNQTLSEFINKINKYALSHAKENKKELKNPRLLKVIIIPIIKFIHNYVIRFGFLDGVYGFVFAFVMSFHSFLSWSNQYLESHKK